MRIAPLILLAALIVPAATAQRIRVAKSGDGRASIDIRQLRVGAGAMDRTFYATLRNDLQRSGYFSIATGNLAEYRVAGTVNGGSAAIQGVDVKGGVVRYSKNASFNTQDAAVRAHVVADELLYALRGVKGFASARLALIGTRTGHKELYTCGSDGGQLLRITTDKSISLAPGWGRDGMLYYTSYYRGWPDICRVDVRTYQRKVMASFSGLNTGAAIAPSNREMAMVLSKDSKPEVYVMNLGNMQPKRITNTRLCAKSSPAWSPDGSQICYVSDEGGKPDLYVISRSGGRPRRITTQGRENVSPSWGPAGIAYSSRVGGRYRIALADPAGRNPTVMLTPDSADFEGPSWAPDGRHIACSRSVNYRSSVYLLDSKEPSRLEPLVQGNGDWYSPSWTP